MSLALVPSYGMRYLAKVLKATLAEKFPDAGEAELYKASADPPRPAPPHPTQNRDPVRGAQKESVPHPATRPGSPAGPRRQAGTTGQELTEAGAGSSPS